MHPRNRFIWAFALTLMIAFGAACGGAAEEAPEPEPEPAVEAPAPAPEVVPEPEPEPQEPAAPVLEGNIIDSDDDFGWLTSGDRDTPATFYWALTLTNDTTQTLDITVQFDFVDENDGVVKSEAKTLRLAPADSSSIREEGEMSREDSLRVVGYTYVCCTWTIIQDQ